MSAERYEIIDQGCRVKIICPDGSVECFDPSTVGVPNLDDVAAGAIRQQARDIAELRERLARLGHAHLDGEHMNGPVDTCLLCQAITARDQLRADLAAAVAERDEARTAYQVRNTEWHQHELIALALAERYKLRAERAEARLAAIDSARTVIIAHFLGGIGVPDGTELIVRPAKDQA